MLSLQGKNIVVGVTGCIAAYKTAEFIRLLVKAGASVEVIMTESATQFITPLTLSTLSRNKVHIDMFEEPEEYSIDHISLADKSDAFIIVPATANIIGKIANGIADDLLTTTVMAVRCPILIAPAMNSNMWANSIVQENINNLKGKGYHFVDPEEGDLACGYQGEGRLRNLEEIFCRLEVLFKACKKLKGKKIVLTIGPTREYIDPVRFITNKSSGKMGISIAVEALKMGAEVTAISTVPVSVPGVKIISVETSLQMKKELETYFPSCDVLIMAAAVSDYTVKDYSETKLKKDPQRENFELNLVKTPDLIAEIAKIKKPGQLIVGFAAETDNLITNAREKLITKNLDMIVANDVSRVDIGMNSDFNEVTVIYPDGKMEQLEKDTKQKVACALLERILALF